MIPNHSPRRIVSLQPSATVILNAIGELERVVACTRYCADVVPEVKNGWRAILSDSWTANAEQILAVQPDLVIACVPYQEKAVAEILQAGVRFLGLAPKTLTDIYGDILAIAGLVGRSNRGEAVILDMQSRIEEARHRTERLAKPRVFCEEWGKPLIASQPWVAELVEATGGEFIAAAGKKITPEEVMELNPEVVIAAWCGAGDRVPLEKIIADRHWGDMAAVRTGSVYCVSDELLNTPAPTLLGGLEALAWAIHPEVFPNTKGIRKITAVSGGKDENLAR